ncbi:hypothetical protein [Corallococcus interemptor]|uniref:hypothetical protein n=1 Tax=Corallococcus interemptor TaxID=2316720 RepID=UPI0011C404A1|nr:hypothetical protein [Corallococcus interemptor]
MSSAVSRTPPRWAARLVVFAALLLSAFSLPASAATNTESTQKANGYNMAQATSNGRTIQGNLDFLGARIQTDQRPAGNWLHEGSLYPNEKTSRAACRAGRPR